jgi:SOS-response transcriptional repressor LexA
MTPTEQGRRLTGAQRHVLEAVRAVCEDGWTATVREVADRAGLASPSTVWHHLNALEDQGLIERHPRNPKGGWRPVDALDEYLASPRSPFMDEHLAAR